MVQLDLLGVDQDHPHLLRRRPQEDRGEHRVDAARLARAGGAGDQQVRHPRQVAETVWPAMSLPSHTVSGLGAGPGMSSTRSPSVTSSASGSGPRRRRPACRGSARGCGSRWSPARRPGRRAARRRARPSCPGRAGARSASRAGPRRCRRGGPRRRARRARRAGPAMRSASASPPTRPCPCAARARRAGGTAARRRARRRRRSPAARTSRTARPRAPDRGRRRR